MITAEWTETDPPRVGQLPRFGDKSVLHFFGTREFSWTDLERMGPAARLRQVHGNRILCVGDNPLSSSPLGEADALIGDRPGIVLTIASADCAPLLFFNPRRRLIGAAHAGWRGTVQGIAPEVVKRFGELFGSVPQELRVAIGPCIGPCCYEVGAEVLDRLPRSLPDGILKRHRSGHGMLDLAALNRHQLLEAGVAPERIHSASLCTACHVERFYSYRREGSLRASLISGIMLQNG